MSVQLEKTVREQLKRGFNPNETMQVLTHNVSVYWSWGVSKRIAYRNDEQQVTGLLLKVNGNHHKGYVLITLDWMDVYEVTIINNRGRILNKYENVYMDMLTEVIDNRIEKIPDYVF